MINFPNSQIANISKININASRKSQPIRTRSGKSKIPITTNIATAIKKINPTKKAFIFNLTSSIILYLITAKKV